MRLTRAASFLLLGALLAPARGQQSVISTYAGGAPPPTPTLSIDKAIGDARALATDDAGNLYFVTFNCVFKLDRSGVITRVAGISPPGYSGDGGPAIDAQLSRPGGLALDGAGNLFIADIDNHRIRKVSADGIISTVAGNGELYPDPIDGIPAGSAYLISPTEVANDGVGNLFIKEARGIRKVSPSGVITTAMSAVPCVYSCSAIISGVDQSPCIGAGIAGDAAGNLFFQDYFRIRKLSPDGTIVTVAGNGTRGCSGDGGPAVDAQLSSALDGLAVDAGGNVFIGDDGNRRVRKISPDGIITTVAGNGSLGHSGDGGPATSAELYATAWVALDAARDLFIAEIGNIRKVAPNGTIATITGNGGLFADYSGDGGPASSATGAWGPLAVDGAGHLFIASGGHIRKISSDGIITTVASDSLAGSSIAADRAGNVYIADPSQNVILILRPVNGPF